MVDPGTRPADRPPAVLLPAGVAPARSLVVHGIPVIGVTQDPKWLTPTARGVSEVRRAPSEWDSSMDRWFSKQRFPAGAAIIPGNDDAAWWLAHFSGSEDGVSLATPGATAIGQLLVKRRLYELCLAHDVPAPRTWMVEPGSALPQPSFPVVIKPQMRVGLQHWTRGRLIRNAKELAEGVEWFHQSVSYRPEVVAADATVGLPLVQEFVQRPGNRVYHLVGYRSRAGESVFAAHWKVLQYPLRFGSGLCFESCDVDEALAERLDALLAAAGFHGIFEAECLEEDGRLSLIDLNPRIYNGISLETRRGYDLCWYLYLDTVGAEAELSAELARARALQAPPMAWRDSIRFWTMLAGQTLSGGLSVAETRAWVRWSRSQSPTLVDPHFVKGDLRAGMQTLLQHLAGAALDPRAFLGTYFRRGLDR